MNVGYKGSKMSKTINLTNLETHSSVMKKAKTDLYQDFTKEEAYHHFTWKEGTDEQKIIVEKFRDIFIDNDYERLKEIFDDDFGIHNGYELMNYVDVEFDEFKVKCEKFGLTKNAEIYCSQISQNLIYFSLGNKNDKALFEAIFYYNHKTNKLKGNQYFFKTEPKMQFNLSKEGKYSFNRRVNVKATSNDIVIKAILPKRDGEDFRLGSCTLADFLGGHFYHITYSAPIFGEKTYWEILRFVTNVGTISYPVLMRGRDHPLFIDNLYPIIEKKKVTFKEGIFPVILSIFFYDKDEEDFYKYPIKNEYLCEHEVKFSCLTDTLSFDWIIERTQQSN